MYPQPRTLTGHWRGKLGAAAVAGLLGITAVLLASWASPLRWPVFVLIGLVLTAAAAGWLWRYCSRQLAEELRQRDQSFLQLMAHALDLTIVTDNQGRVEFASPAVTRFLGGDAQQLVGNSLYQFIHPGDVPGVQSTLQNLTLHCGKPAGLEFRLRHADGSWRPLQAVGHSFFIWGSQQFIAFSARDLTEIRKLQEQVRQAQPAAGAGHQSVRSTAHDINNSLAVIQMRLDLLKQSGLSPEALSESLEAIEKAGRRAAQLTRQLLTPNQPPAP
ncbi:MAG TPA: PAS domain S-box protein [Verrucomicrobiota bacterium]|nr:PAS domain S-box protein [Verrucomicrobiota bacterium]HNT15462.1 PAS domain S-box protein [Verrucomicrobiota bacterium]